LILEAVVSFTPPRRIGGGFEGVQVAHAGGVSATIQKIL